MRGEVVLVGAGPGDPGLMTLAGLEALARAEVLVHDFLVDPRVLAMAPAGAKRIYAGKRAGQHRFSQAWIHRILLAHARAGRRVVRLKGGDSFVFGRGGEEAEACRAAGVPFRVVPGVTSGTAVPACAGIPVTHRGLASAVAFVTAHEGKGQDWALLARFPGTLVFFMGRAVLGGICRSLVRHGLAASTPAVAIRWGSLPEQETVSGTLATLPRRSRQLGTPALIVVGKVASLRPRLAWLERQPLFGRTVLVTRAREQASRLEAMLSAEGARVLVAPSIRIAFLPVRMGKRELASFDWLVFASPHGVEAFLAGLDSRSLAGIRVAALGPATAQALRERGILPDLVSKIPTSRGLARALAFQIRGKRILLPRSDIAPSDLPALLRKAGARVDPVVAYRTLPEPFSAETRAALREGRVDAVLFSSASTVRNFLAACRRSRIRLRRRGAWRAVSIGPETSRALRAAGIRPSAEAGVPGLEGLLAALKRALTPPRRRR